MKIEIAPSILASDFSRLGEAVEEIDASGADLVHFDVMDGKFVPNLTFGPPVVKAVRGRSKLPFDVHLMIERPWEIIDDFVDAGADGITIHAEACTDLNRVAQMVKRRGIPVGVALNPHTSLEQVRHVLDQVDLLLVMTVSPGFGGQSYIAGMTDKVREARSLIDHLAPTCRLQVDGGIDAQTAPVACDAGARVLVAGTSVFNAPTVAEGVASLREAATSRLNPS